MKVLNCFLLFIFTCLTSGYAQYNNGTHHSTDSSGHKGEHPHLKTEKGPNHGRMIQNKGVKVEMVTPSNVKKFEVSYYVFDSLTNPLDAKAYTGTVKYIFGGANQYLQVKLVPSGKTNQYVATLEGWNEYKKAIVTLKANDQVYTFTYHNYVAPTDQSQTTNLGGQQHHRGGGGGGGGGGMNGGGMNGGGMNGGGMNGGGMNGGGMNGGGMNGR
jgi:hypothetical protein